MFAKRLRKLRLEAELTQAELAKRLGLDHTTISSYERGVSTPNHELLAKIASVFGVSVDYLLGHTELRTKTRCLPK